MVLDKQNRYAGFKIAGLSSKNYFRKSKYDPEKTRMKRILMQQSNKRKMQPLNVQSLNLRIPRIRLNTEFGKFQIKNQGIMTAGFMSSQENGGQRWRFGLDFDLLNPYHWENDTIQPQGGPLRVNYIVGNNNNGVHYSNREYNIDIYNKYQKGYVLKVKYYIKLVPTGSVSEQNLVVFQSHKHTGNGIYITPEGYIFQDDPQGSKPLNTQVYNKHQKFGVTHPKDTNVDQGEQKHQIILKGEINPIKEENGNYSDPQYQFNPRAGTRTSNYSSIVLDWAAYQPNKPNYYTLTYWYEYTVILSDGIR